MTQDSNSMDNRTRKVFGKWGAGFVVGLAVGTMLGIATGNIGVGIALGGGIGVAVAEAFAEDDKRRRERSAALKDLGG